MIKAGGFRTRARSRAVILTKEAAFEAAVAAASNALKGGFAVSINVEGSKENEPALGAS